MVPESILEEARFDHVSDAGELVFVSGKGKFRVKVDETLERAILEAKQIRSEVQKERQSHAPATLPISQIQSLIRAGADPARVAERYSLNEALVRRFSSAVETEKQYAIKQFLSTPAPKESRVHTLSELIERTFAAARVRLEDVTWRATRRGLEPWRISAQFVSGGRTLQAEWSWNMHDNAVNCLNAVARKLIGEQDAQRGGNVKNPMDENFFASLNLPGNSARSARIEQTVSAWNTPEPSMPAVSPSEPPSVPITPSGTNAKSDTDADERDNDSDTPNTTSMSTTEQNSDSPVGQQTNASDTPSGGETTANHTQNATKSKRRAGRSAVPSWDEILFGD